MLRAWSYRERSGSSILRPAGSAGQCGADIGCGQDVVERLPQALEHLLELHVGVGQGGCKAEDVIAEAAEHQAVAPGRREDAVRQRERCIEAALARLVAHELERS